jgi:DNA polymerase III epsilon subunit-like protein
MMNQNGRRAAIQIAREKLTLNPVYLDTETTGIGPYDEIVDICIVDHDGQVLLDTLVKPTFRIPTDAAAIHGISNEMVANAPEWLDVWDEVRGILEGRHVGVYNADFDTRLIDQTNQVHNIAWRFPKERAFCIMKLYATFYGAWNRRFRSYRWQKLGNAGAQCGIDIPNSHRAKDDTLLARAVLHYMANQ